MITRFFCWLFEGPCNHRWDVLTKERVPGVIPPREVRVSRDVMLEMIAASRDSVMVVLACERCGATKTEVMR